MNKELLQQALDALENSSSLVFNDVTWSHQRGLTIRALREALAQPAVKTCVELTPEQQESLRCKNVVHIPGAIAQSVQPVERHIKLVPIRQLFDDAGNQVCDTGAETCHFYVAAQSQNYSASCNHCQRGIPNNKPHRLCPVLYRSQS